MLHLKSKNSFPLSLERNRQTSTPTSLDKRIYDISIIKNGPPSSSLLQVLQEYVLGRKLEVWRGSAANLVVQTSLTQSRGSTVVSLIQRSKSLIWGERRPVLMSSRSASISYPTNMSNSLQRLWKPPVFVPTDT